LPPTFGSYWIVFLRWLTFSFLFGMPQRLDGWAGEVLSRNVGVTLEPGMIVHTHLLAELGLEKHAKRYFEHLIHRVAGQEWVGDYVEVLKDLDGVVNYREYAGEEYWTVVSRFYERMGVPLSWEEPVESVEPLDESKQVVEDAVVTDYDHVTEHRTSVDQPPVDQPHVYQPHVDEPHVDVVPSYGYYMHDPVPVESEKLLESKPSVPLSPVHPLPGIQPLQAQSVQPVNSTHEVLHSPTGMSVWSDEGDLFDFLPNVPTTLPLLPPLPPAIAPTSPHSHQNHFQNQNNVQMQKEERKEGGKDVDDLGFSTASKPKTVPSKPAGMYRLLRRILTN
jgi:hypothetical protein